MLRERAMIIEREIQCIVRVHMCLGGVRFRVVGVRDEKKL